MYAIKFLALLLNRIKKCCIIFVQRKGDIMGSYRNRRVDELRDDRLMGISASKEELKNDDSLDPYVVFVAGAHVGFDKCRVIATVVYAKNKKQAAYFAGDLPRAKGDQKYSIIACEKLCDRNDKIGIMQVYLINELNDFNPYMYSTRNGFDSKRKNMFTNLETHRRVDDYYRHGKSAKHREELEEIKTADSFDEEDVLPRHCAPRLVNGIPVATKRVNVAAALMEWFTVEVKKYAMRPLRLKNEAKKIMNKEQSLWSDKEKQTMRFFEQNKYEAANLVMLYYKLFGKDNPLGIRYYKKTIKNENGEKAEIDVISYLNDEGKLIAYRPPEKLAKSLYYDEETEPFFKMNRQEEYVARTEEEVKASGKSRIEKFLERQSKAIKQEAERE